MKCVGNLFFYRLLVLHGSVYSQISFLNEIAAMENITSPFLFSLGQEGLKVSFKGREYCFILIYKYLARFLGGKIHPKLPTLFA